MYLPYKKMVYKKIIKRGNRTYGPYLYENKRVGNKVITTYVGRAGYDEKKRKFNFLPYILGIVFIFLISFFVLSNFYPTGKVALTLDESYIRGDVIKGNLKLTLKEGELLPKDSKVFVSFGNQDKEFLLSDLVVLETFKGGFFVEGVDIVGVGDGYGLKGNREDYPTLDFEVDVYKIAEESSVKDEKEEKKEEAEVVIEEEEKKNEEGEQIIEEGSSDSEPETSSGIDNSIIEGGAQQEQQALGNEGNQENVGEQADTVENSEITAGTSGTTGAVISGGNEESIRKISGKVSKEQEFEFELQEGESAKLVEGSVKHNDSVIGDDKVKFEIVGKKVIVKTDYSVIEKGVGEDFLGENELELDINLSLFNINASESGTFRIEVNYEETKIIEIEKDIEVRKEGIKEQIMNESVINETIPLLNETNVSVNISEELNVSINLTNETMVNISLSNVSIKTLRYKIRAGEPVRWIKNVTLKEAKEIAIELPKEAENISVKKFDNKGEKEALVKIGGLTGNVISGRISAELELEKDKGLFGLLKKIFRKLTGRVTGRAVSDLGLNETNQSVINIVLADNATQYIIEYYTDAPQVSEEQKENGKKVIVSGPDSLNYTDVLVLSNLSRKIAVKDSEKIRVYWYNYEYAEKKIALKEVDEVQEIEVVEEEREIKEEINEGAAEVNESVVNETQNVIEGEISIEDINNSSEVINETNENNSEINLSLTVGDSLITGNIIAEDNSSDGLNNDINNTTKDNNGSLSFSENEIISDESGRGYTKESLAFEVYDYDEDEYIDYIEWVAPHLSNQTFEIIEITKAEHLDENKLFIEDIYENVRERDGNWSSGIEAGHYVRVTFEQNLTRDKDITIYARANCVANSTVKINGSDVPCEIYKKKLRLDSLKRGEI
ncbi:MAG: hypothetical protein AABW75_03015 [Nanoarchaeota archaeon]